METLDRQEDVGPDPRSANVLPKQRQPARATPGRRREAGSAPPPPNRARRRGTSFGHVRGISTIQGYLLLEQHYQQREDQDVEAKFRYRRIAEGAIEGDEAKERTQSDEDRNGGARVDHERSDKHPAY